MAKSNMQNGTTQTVPILKQEVFRVDQQGQLELLEGAAVVDQSYEKAELLQPPHPTRSLVFRLQAGGVSQTEDVLHYLREPAMQTVSTLVKNWYEQDRYFLRLYDDEPAR
jgi:hypothetical protein